MHENSSRRVNDGASKQMRHDAFSQPQQYQKRRSIKRGGASSLSSGISRIIPQYCDKCEEKNIKSVLGERKFLEDEPIPADAKDWKQCYLCGHIIHVRHIPESEELVSEIEASNNPYQDMSGHIGGIDKRSNKKGKNRKVDLINDPDLKLELKKAGTKLISYSTTGD
jgi:hypothetical protein